MLQSMMLSLVTSVINLGFSLVVKSTGLRNCPDPALKSATDVSIACGAGLFRSGIPQGLGELWANGNTRQSRGLVWERCLCVSSLAGEGTLCDYSCVTALEISSWAPRPLAAQSGCSLPLMFGSVPLERRALGISKDTQQGVCSCTATGSRKKPKFLYQYKKILGTIFSKATADRAGSAGFLRYSK